MRADSSDRTSDMADGIHTVGGFGTEDPDTPAGRGLVAYFRDGDGLERPFYPDVTLAAVRDGAAVSHLHLINIGMRLEGRRRARDPKLRIPLIDRYRLQRWEADAGPDFVGHFPNMRAWMDFGWYAATAGAARMTWTMRWLAELRARKERETARDATSP